MPFEIARFNILAALSLTAGLALVLSVLLTRLVLSVVRRRQLGQQVREDGPESHRKKQGTPSLGGLAILGAVVAATVVGISWVQVRLDRYNAQVWYVLGMAGAFGLLGLFDDLAKMRDGSTRGIPARYRILLQIAIALVFLRLMPHRVEATPFQLSQWGFSELLNTSAWWGGLAWTVLGALVVVGSANAVNFTDGVDGLAATAVAVCALCLAVVFQVPWGVPAVALAGAAAGFLWFNAHPAKIFMGDVGSLGMGAMLGGIAVATDRQWLFALCAVVFVVEVLSVMLQVVWFRCTGGKRLFRMTPIHHAFELRGWSEPQVVARFGLIGLLAGCVALTWYFSTIGP